VHLAGGLVITIAGALSAETRTCPRGTPAVTLSFCGRVDFLTRSHSMKSLLVSAIAIASMLILSAAGAPGLAASPRSPSPSRSGSTKAEAYSVVKIGDEVKVIKKSDLSGLKKSTADEDKKDLKAYQDAKKEFSKSKDKSAMPKKPVKRSVHVLKSSLKTQQEAEAWMSKYLEGKKDGPKAGKTASNW